MGGMPATTIDDTEMSAGTGMFPYLVLGSQLLVFIFFAVGTKQEFALDDLTEEFTEVQMYNYLIGVTLMMTVGFGYLMTFLQYYGLGAVGLTLFITALGMEVSIIFEALFSRGGWTEYVNVDIAAYLNADFAVAAFLISFGGIIGKANPTQLTIMTIVESFCYCFNKRIILMRWIPLVDVGGTIVIHMFGAYFGLAVAKVLGTKPDMSKETSSHTSDLFSLLGTIVLWVYWPSFVGGSLSAGSSESELALTNTITALIGSTLATFALSAIFTGGFIRPVDIQNATLAGGVAIGATANLDMGPGVALAVGFGAGAISSLGYNKIQGWLLETIGLHDSCGIHNLHGMPSIFGGIFSALLPLAITDSNEGNCGYQFAGIGMTLVIALFTGTLTGFLLKLFEDKQRGLKSYASTVGMDDSAFMSSDP